VNGGEIVDQAELLREETFSVEERREEGLT
jgi:hypothetical protein